MNRGVQAIAVVAFALMSAPHAFAANKSKVITNAENSYNFRCVGPALDLTLTSFSLPISRTNSNPITGAVGKPATSALTVEFPAGKSYSTLYSQIIHGDHYSSCTLTETVTTPASAGVAAGATVFHWTFSQVTPTALTAIWKDGSEAGSASPGTPVAMVRATFAFSEVRLEDGSGSSSAGAVDSWTATQ